MSIVDYLEMLPQTITIKPFATQSKYGGETFGTGVDYRARVIYKPHLIRNSEGNEQVARGEIWLGPPVSDLSNAVVPTIDPKSQIVFEGDNLIILSFSRVPDELDNHHIKIHFG